MPKYQQSETIRRLFNRGQPMAIGKNEVILGNDATPNGVYYIATGYIKIYSISDNGDEYVHIIYGPGEIFPIIWAYLGIEPESLFYESISECTLWRISKKWFQEFIRTDVPFSYAMSLQLAQQFRIYTDRVDNLEYKKASERIAYRLLFLASRFGMKSRGIIVIDVPITHEIFANSVNLARESVSREIEKLERKQIVKQVDGHLHILDVGALAGQLSRPGSLGNWNLL